MKLSKSQSPEGPVSLTQAYLWAVVFFAIGIGSIVWPIDEFLTMVSAITDGSESVSVRKGVYYLLGGGIFFVVMVYGLIYPRFYKPFKSRTERTLVWVMLAGVGLIFVLPQAVHFGVDTLLTRRGYQVCEAQSTRWLHVVKIVYSKTVPCEEPTPAPASSYRSTKH